MSLVDDVVAATIDLTDIELVEGAMTRRVQIRPEFSCFNGCAFDSPTCSPGAGGFHGLGGRRVTFSVSMEGVGAVAFDLSTPIYPPSVSDRGRRNWSPLGPLDLHYVNPPEYLRELGWSTEECLYTGGHCWTDVTFLQADTAVEALLSGGVKGVWAWLAEGWLPRLVET